MSNPTYFFVWSQGASQARLEGKFASEFANASVEQATPLATLGGLYWFVEVPGYEDQRAARSGMHVLSTEEIAAAMDGGHAARAISGPFRTREEAERSFERYWEMGLSDDDDD